MRQANAFFVPSDFTGIPAQLPAVMSRDYRTLMLASTALLRSSRIIDQAVYTGCGAEFMLQ